MEFWLFLIVSGSTIANGPIGVGPFESGAMCEQAGKSIAAEFKSDRLAGGFFEPQVKFSCLPIQRRLGAAK